jgi:hypothetical protein
VLNLYLILVGATLATLGWGWSGIAASRAAWVATGVPALLLAGITIFAVLAGSNEAAFPKSESEFVAVWAFGAVAAVLGGVAAAMGAWGVASDLAFGFFAFFFSAGAALSTAAYAVAASGGFNILALGLLMSSVAGGLIFLSAAVVPGSRGLRGVAGWLLVLFGISVAFLGYAPLIHVQF